MKFKHADIPAALALVREQLEEEGKRLFAAGAKAMTDKDAATAKSILRALLKKDDGSGKAHLDAKGVGRYYTDIAIPYGGANYLLTSQIFPNSYGPLVKWLKSKGYKKSDIDAAGKKN